ncbi:MAG: dTDP-4-dehydrorhamnose 3,5-epimerase [Elusimicrobiota bacterium]
MPFEFEKLSLDGLILIKPKMFIDKRGFFMETFKKSEFSSNGINCDFLQDNHSRSFKNVIRGIHFQKEPKAQSKLVRCVRGEIYDVAVDLRKESKTYLKWYGVKLSDENGFMLFIPKGFGHAFLVLSEEADVVYKCDEEYSPEHDCGIRYDDPSIGIKWGVSDPIVSEKDLKLPFLELK